MKRYRLEKRHISKLGSEFWLRWGEPFDTFAEAERTANLAMKDRTCWLRIIEVTE